MKSKAMAIFIETLAQFTAAQLAADRGKVFRKSVGGRIIEECNVTTSSACTHYNTSKKGFAKMNPENEELMKLIGRPEGKNNGGPKPKVKLPEAEVKLPEAAWPLRLAATVADAEAETTLAEELMQLLADADAEAAAEAETTLAEELMQLLADADAEAAEAETTLAEELDAQDFEDGENLELDGSTSIEFTQDE